MPTRKRKEKVHPGQYVNIDLRYNEELDAWQADAIVEGERQVTLKPTKEEAVESMRLKLWKKKYLIQNIGDFVEIGDHFTLWQRFCLEYKFPNRTTYIQWLEDKVKAFEKGE